VETVSTFAIFSYEDVAIVLSSTEFNSRISATVAEIRELSRFFYFYL